MLFPSPSDLREIRDCSWSFPGGSFGYAEREGARVVTLGMSWRSLAPRAHFVARALGIGTRPTTRCSATMAKDEMKRVHGNLHVHMVPALSDNYVFIIQEQTFGKVAVIDPSEFGPVSNAVDAIGLKGVDYIYNTHHHWDHTDGNLQVKEKYGCHVYGFKGDSARIPGIDVELVEGSDLIFGDEPVLIFETPGHTSGHISFYFSKSKVAFVGDTLFAMGCGRLFEGSPQQMHESLQKLVSALPPETTVYCAHEYTASNAKFAATVEPENSELMKRCEEVRALRAKNIKTVPTTMDLELKTNPFLRCKNSADFARVRKLKDNF